MPARARSLDFGARAWRPPCFPVPRLRPRASGQRGLGRATEDARYTPLLFALLVLLGVRRDDDLLALRQVSTLERRLNLFCVERLALDEGIGKTRQLLAPLGQQILH